MVKYLKQHLIRVKKNVYIAKVKMENDEMKFYSIRDGKFRLNRDEIDEVVLRVKAFIVSSKNNMIIGHDNEGYKLLEVSVGADEDIKGALKNGIYLETGIALDGRDQLEPFYEVRYYNKNYKGSGVNRLSDTIYFLINAT